MDQRLQKDIEFTHSMLNFINAAFQGRFTFYNILDQLCFQSLPIEEIERSQRVLDKVTRWKSQLFGGALLFSSAANSPESFEAQNALELLENLRPDLTALSQQCAAILGDNQTPSKPENVKLLIAAYGRFAYSREHYIKGFLELGSLMKLIDILERFNPLALPAQQDVARANELVTAYKPPSQVNPQFFGYLQSLCLHLPSIFLSAIHDINLLISPYKGGISYAGLGIPAQEGKQWQDYGFSPSQAGYWRAYYMGPEEAASWMKCGFQSAQSAADWRALGIPSQVAPYWLARGFNPFQAVPWFQAGIDPDQALEHIRNGINHPAQLRQGS
ncbi:MAG: hypothetical protein K1X79_04275 [Oligoflexia bacterium]|nr:hypothetical protein [Oligoflexia bacterium]